MKLSHARVIGILLNNVDLLFPIVFVNILEILAHFEIPVDDKLLFKCWVKLARKCQLCDTLLLLLHVIH